MACFSISVRGFSLGRWWGHHFSDAHRACTVRIQSWLHKLCGRIHENSWDAHLCLTCARQWKTDELRINCNLPISSLDIYGYLGSSFYNSESPVSSRNSAKQQSNSSLSSEVFFCHCTLWWTNILPWKITMLLMGKSTISMAIYQ